jgi:hypothetical protein
MYRYAENEVEQIEFCLQTRVPSFYGRLVLGDGNVLAEQRFVVNCAGSGAHLKKKSASKQIEAVLGDPNEYVIYLTRYHLEGGVVKSAEERHEVGGEIHHPTREYTYASDGQLQRIVQHWPSGDRTLFAAKTKTTLKSLSEHLSTKIAEAIVARLRKERFDAPLLALELSYREGDHHIPLLIPLTQKDEVERLTLAAEIPASRWLRLNDADFEPALAELNQRVQDGGNESAIAKMLRAAALEVTRSAKDLPVAEGFVAYAIDWELEGDDIAKILAGRRRSRSRRGRSAAGFDSAASVFTRSRVLRARSLRKVGKGGPVQTN